MIEFKAECGHTVRARDEDAGSVVRCSYCGRPANVPDEAGDELDFLFNDVEQPAEESGRRKRGKRIPGGGVFAKKRGKGEFNPFPIVLRLCYAALLIVIVIFVGRMYVLPLIHRIMEHQPVVVPLPPVNDIEDEPEPATSPRERYGLFTEELDDGLVYVFTVPPSEGAIVCFIEVSDRLGPGPFFRDDRCTPCLGGRCEPPTTRDPNKVYVVEAALRIGDARLTRYPRHTDLRRQIRAAPTDAARNRLVKRYFVPDGGVVLFHETDGQEFLVRQYHNVKTHKREPTVIRALFLPRIPRASGPGFSIERLVQENFIPNEVNYGFSLEGVKSELHLDEVPESDQPHIVKALQRIGVISYVRPDNQVRLIAIDVKRGWIGVENISDASP